MEAGTTLVPESMIAMIFGARLRPSGYGAIL